MLEKFIEMEYVVFNDNHKEWIEEIKKRESNLIGIYKNNKYQVVKRRIENIEDSKYNIIWLSIKRIDKESIHDWRELQDIKNQLVGEDNEGIELYPSEKRLVDTSNQYHLWVYETPGLLFPFGFNERLLMTEEEAVKYGSKQRERK